MKESSISSPATSPVSTTRSSVIDSSRLLTFSPPSSSTRCMHVEPSYPQARIFPSTSRVVSLEKGQFLFRQTGNIVANVWMDKKIVSALSTMSDPDISHSAKRKQKDGTTLMVDCPSSIVAYNKYIGGVDRGDQLRSY